MTTMILFLTSGKQLHVAASVGEHGPQAFDLGDSNRKVIAIERERARVNSLGTVLG